MKGLLRGFVRLPIGDKIFFIKALILSAFLRVYLKLFGFNHTLKLLSCFYKGANCQKHFFDIGGYRTSIELCYMFSPYLNCLAICTAHWWLLKIRGIPVNMKFGMKKQNNKLAAHAWLEYNGEPFGENNYTNKKFTAFETSIL
jgi:hypothetical protein